MVERDIGAAQQVGDFYVGCRRAGHAGEGADLDHLAVDVERPRRQLQQFFDRLLGLFAAVVRKDAGDCELVAANAADNRALTGIFQNGNGYAAEQ